MPFEINSIKLDRPLLLAPMDDISDIPFRLICREFGAGLVFTEFTSCEALIRGVQRSMNRIAIAESERPIGIQIFGGNPDSIARAVELVAASRPDLIDINCGCWARNHAARGEGAGLLRDLPRLEQVVKAAVRATDLPVTVKTRLGWDEQSIVILEVARIVEQAGARALTVHCRTRAQAYKGRADWSWLEKIRKVITIPLIGNGDVICGADAKALFELGCDGVMIGRAAVTHPWVFREVRHFLETGQCLPLPTVKERLELCLRHLDLGVEHKGDYWGRTHFRKYYFGYLREFPEAAHLRSEFMHTADIDQVRCRLRGMIDNVGREDEGRGT